MSEEKLQLKSISSLLSEKFVIPAYQRGFRWDKTQVVNLLDDIWNFKLDSDKNINTSIFYCLQPVVVSKKNNEWELIDGQQRLTTIYLILYHFRNILQIIGKTNYSIHYETRPDSESFLKQIDLDKKKKNIDFYHFCIALETIEEWFTNRDQSVGFNFITTLLNTDEIGKNVKVIWYDVTDENVSDKYAIDIFTRLNIGKIPLTNSELIKALFLSKAGNNNKCNKTISYNEQLLIATDWDRIEQTLQQNEFWYFICNTPNKYENRIEYIFDLMMEKGDDHENYFTFYKFIDKLSSDISVNQIWTEIKSYFLTFEEWFQDQFFYHLIGYLVNVDKNKTIVKHLKALAVENNKTDYKYKLKEMALKTLDEESFDNLNFDYDKKEIKKTLLLFNIVSILENLKSNIRFPFEYYSIQKWDIEHIRSRTSMDIFGKDRETWALANIEYFTGIRWAIENETPILEQMQMLTCEESAVCSKLIKILKNEDDNDIIFNETYSTLKEIFKNDENFDSIDGIANLTLLDESTNRMYKNAFFPVKRKYIISQEKQGIFIPLCTKNVFLKAYSKKMENVMSWDNCDADDYVVEIKRMLDHE